jgi:hypothetical protein
VPPLRRITAGFVDDGHDDDHECRQARNGGAVATHFRGAGASHHVREALRLLHVDLVR